MRNKIHVLTWDAQCLVQNFSAQVDAKMREIQWYKPVGVLWLQNDNVWIAVADVNTRLYSKSRMKGVCVRRVSKNDSRVVIIRRPWPEAMWCSGADGVDDATNRRWRPRPWGLRDWHIRCQGGLQRIQGRRQHP